MYLPIRILAYRHVLCIRLNDKQATSTPAVLVDGPPSLQIHVMCAGSICLDLKAVLNWYLNMVFVEFHNNEPQAPRIVLEPPLYSKQER